MLAREVLFNICRSASRSPLITPSSTSRFLHSSTVLQRQRTRIVASGVSKPSGGKRIHASLNENKRKKWVEATEKEKSLRDLFPEDNVFVTSLYAPELFSLSQAVDILREMAAPEMLDHTEGELHVKVQINMRTGKSTKFVQSVDTTIEVPHRPTFLRKRKIIVFTADHAMAEAAKAAGAFDAGAENLVAQVEHGFYHWEAYDNVVCHKDFITKMAPIRKLLRDRYPSGNRLTENVMEMLKLHSEGIVITSSKDLEIPEVAHIKLPLGCLSDPKEDMEANLRTYVDSIHNVRSPRITGRFIEKMELIALPNPLSLRLELYPEPQVKTSQKKSKKASKEKQTADVEGEAKETVVEGEDAKGAESSEAMKE